MFPHICHTRFKWYCTRQSAALPLPGWFSIVLLAPVSLCGLTDHSAPMRRVTGLLAVVITSDQVGRMACLPILHLSVLPLSRLIDQHNEVLAQGKVAHVLPVLVLERRTNVNFCPPQVYRTARHSHFPKGKGTTSEMQIGIWQQSP